MFLGNKSNKMTLGFHTDTKELSAGLKKSEQIVDRSFRNIALTARTTLVETQRRMAAMNTTLSNSINQAMSIGAKGTLLVSAPLGFLSYQLANTASIAGEVNNAMKVTFGPEASKMVENYSKNAAMSMGMSKRMYEETSANIGAMLMDVQKGMDPNAAAAQADVLMQRAADLASLKGKSMETALLAFQNASVGEFEVLKQFGIKINEDMIRERAIALGMDGKLTLAQKQEVSLMLLMEKTERAHGDFQNTLKNSAENQKKAAAAQLENAKADFGKNFLPILLKVLVVTNKVLGAINNLSEGKKKFISYVIMAGTVLFPLIFVLASVAKTILFVKTALAVLNMTMAITGVTSKGLLVTMGPWAAVFIALGAAIYILVKHWERFTSGVRRLQRALMGLSKWIKAHGGNILEFFAGIGGKLGGVGGDPSSFNQQPGRAATGRGFWAGGAVRVGENGPETVVLPRGSRIKPAGSSGGSGSTQVTLEQHVHTNSSPDSVAKASVFALKGAF